jgi:hypothetical protein
MTDAQEQKLIGADGYVASMREALDATLAALGKPLESVTAPESQSDRSSLRDRRRAFACTLSRGDLR